MINFNNPAGGTARALVNLPASTNSTTAFAMSISSKDPVDQVNLSYVIFMAKDGTMVVAPGSSREEAEQRRDEQIDKQVGNFTVVQSDFLNAKSGDTTSFVQFKNRTVSQVIDIHLFKKRDDLSNAKLGTIQSFEMTNPYRVSAIAWKTTGGEFLLMSMSLRSADLVAMAEGVPK